MPANTQTLKRSTPIEPLLAEYRKTKNAQLRDDIAQSCAYMAKILANRYTGRGIEFDDLYQVASLGLLYAIDRFDPAYNVQFSTFAAQTIAGEIKKYFRDTGHFIRVPRKMYEAFSRAEKLGSAESVQSPTSKRPYHMVSFEQVLSQNQNHVLENVIGQNDDSFLLVEDKDFVYRCLASLTGEEHTFIVARYYDENTQQQIAEKMHVSQMYISRLEKKVLKKLRDFYKKD